MRQSARLSSGRVVSKYGTHGNIKKKPQVQKILKTDSADDNTRIIEPVSELKNLNEDDDGDIISTSQLSDDGGNDSDDSIEHDGEGTATSELDEIKRMDKEDALAHIKKNYANPESIICYASVSGLKDLFKNLSEEEIKGTLSTFETWSLMKSSRDPKKYNPFIAQHIRDVMQIDCITVKEIADQNLGINYLLCAIDVFR